MPEFLVGGACHALSLSRVSFFETPWTIASLAPLSMGFSRQEYWGALPSFLQWIFLTKGSNWSRSCLLHWQADSLPLSYQDSPLVCGSASVSAQSLSRVRLCDPMDCSLPGSSVHGDSPGKNIRVGCHVLLQGIFLTQGSNPGLLSCREILYCLNHQGSPGWQLTPTSSSLQYQLGFCPHPVAIEILFQDPTFLSLV